jgi:hypothetical protein
VDLCAIEYTDPDTNQLVTGLTCAEFETWHAEWLACRPVIDYTDCVDEAGVQECEITGYYEPCTEFSYCYVDFTDVNGSSYNVTCGDYYDWLNDYSVQDWCRYLYQTVNCSDLDETQTCTFEYSGNSCYLHDYNCTVADTDGSAIGDCSYYFEDYYAWMSVQEADFWDFSDPNVVNFYQYWSAYWEENKPWEGCDAGFYDDYTNETCYACPAGYYCEAGINLDPIECPLNTFCPAGSASPVGCPDETWTDYTGSSSATDCIGFVECPAG